MLFFFIDIKTLYIFDKIEKNYKGSVFMANKNLIDLDAMSKKQLDMLIKKAKKNYGKILPITDTPATAKFLLRFSMSRAQELKCLFRLQCSNSAAEHRF